MCGMIFAFLNSIAPAYSALAEDAHAGDALQSEALQSIVLQGVYGDELAIEPGEGFAGAKSSAVESSAATVDETELIAVPLPAAMWLFGSALLGFVMLSNRRSI